MRFRLAHQGEVYRQSYAYRHHAYYQDYVVLFVFRSAKDGY